MKSRSRKASDDGYEDNFPPLKKRTAPPPQPVSWANIMAACKLVVSIKPRDPRNPNAMIRYAQNEFFQNFGYSQEDLTRPDTETQIGGLPFHALFGEATIRISINRIQIAILTGKSECEFINLYRSDGVPMSCQLSVLSMTQRSTQTPDVNDEKWAVITIRSASVVGNSKHCGVGLLGTSRIPTENLERIIK